MKHLTNNKIRFSVYEEVYNHYKNKVTTCKQSINVVTNYNPIIQFLFEECDVTEGTMFNKYGFLEVKKTAVCHENDDFDEQKGCLVARMKVRKLVNKQCNLLLKNIEKKIKFILSGIDDAIIKNENICKRIEEIQKEINK